jgi:hypothetical protein
MGGGHGALGGGGGMGAGGAIFAFRGSVTLINSTLTLNVARGGNTQHGPDSGSPGSGRGGGLYILNSSLTLLNATIAENTVAAGTTNGSLIDDAALGYGGGLYADAEGAVVSLAITNSILADSIGVQVQGDACATPSMFAGSSFNNTLAGRNVIGVNGSASNACPAVGSLASFGGTTPLTDSLKDNGGPTLTRYPQNEMLFGAPAQECGRPELHGRDQRGIPRAVNCTVGAVEFPYDAPEPVNPPQLPGSGFMPSACQLGPGAPAPAPGALFGLALAAVLCRRRIARGRAAAGREKCYCSG